jgi:hypothetical protein
MMCCTRVFRWAGKPGLTRPCICLDVPPNMIHGERDGRGGMWVPYSQSRRIVWIWIQEDIQMGKLENGKLGQ